MALLIVGVEPGDEVIVPTLTFIASVNAIRYVQAEPVFMDCDDYYCLDSEKTIAFITEETEFKNGFSYNKKTGKRVAAIVPVNIFGNAVNLDSIASICRQRNIKIVEDSTESLGTRYVSGAFSGKHSGTIGDIGCFSFNGNKIITTGGGGMIVTDNPTYAERARYLTTQAKDDEVRYIHHEVGYNFRLTNIQAALGVAQLEQLPGFIQTKKEHYDYYKNHLSPSVFKIGVQPSYSDNNTWMIALQINLSTSPLDREGWMKKLAEHQIQSRPVWYLNHLQKPFQYCQSYKISKALTLYDVTLNLPCSTGLKLTDIQRVVEVLNG
jgi:dTDP-4-amino-4,6-dideoxygalactose transaminase